MFLPYIKFQVKDHTNCEVNEFLLRFQNIGIPNTNNISGRITHKTYLSMVNPIGKLS